jgi:RNA polymerase sigma-70 factor (ECF subfamily)
LKDPSTGKLDPSIVASLFVEHADELRRFLVGILRDHNTASDVLQITFAKAVEVGHTAREETLKGWLFRVAYNEAIVVKRRQAVRRRAAETLAAEGPPDVPPPDSRLVRFEDVERVRTAMQVLPPEQREVVKLRMYEEMKFIDIAAKLNVPLGTVLTRMQAALKKLRKALEP